MIAHRQHHDAPAPAALASADACADPVADADELARAGTWLLALTNPGDRAAVADLAPRAMLAAAAHTLAQDAPTDSALGPGARATLCRRYLAAHAAVLLRVTLREGSARAAAAAQLSLDLSAAVTQWARSGDARPLVALIALINAPTAPDAAALAHTLDRVRMRRAGRDAAALADLATEVAPPALTLAAAALAAALAALAADPAPAPTPCRALRRRALLTAHCPRSSRARARTLTAAPAAPPCAAVAARA